MSVEYLQKQAATTTTTDVTNNNNSNNTSSSNKKITSQHFPLEQQKETETEKHEIVENFKEKNFQNKKPDNNKETDI